jgi:hypothetical protein
LGFVKTLTIGPIEEHAIPLGFPNGDELHCPGTVQTETDAAIAAAAIEWSLGQSKRIDLQPVVLTNGLIDVIPQIIEAVNRMRAGRHLCLALRKAEAATDAQLGGTEGNGKNADEITYRQSPRATFAPNSPLVTWKMAIRGKNLPP